MNPPENNINIWHRLLRPGSQANMTKLSARYMVPGFNTSLPIRTHAGWVTERANCGFTCLHIDDVPQPILRFISPLSSPPPRFLPIHLPPSSSVPRPSFSSPFSCTNTSKLCSGHIVWLVLNIFHQPTMLTSLQWLELTQDDPQWPKTYSCMGQCIQIDSIKN